MEFLDRETRRQLGFDEVWSKIAPVSSLGRARMRRATPFTSEQYSDLEAEYDRLQRMADDLSKNPKIADDLGFLLRSAKDISGSLKRSMEGAILDDIEFYEVKKLLGLVEKINFELEKLGWTTLLPKSLDQCSECREALSLGQGSYDSFYIADAYNPKLAQIRARRVNLESTLASYRELVDRKLIQAVGRLLSMDGEITLSTVDTAAVAKLEAMHELYKVQEKQNFVTFKLIEGEQMRRTREELEGVRSDEESCKEEVRTELTLVVGEFAPRLRSVLETLEFLDFALAKAKFAAKIGGVKPILSEDSRIRIQGGRHLIVEEEVKRGGQDYTPLSLEVLPGVTLITGPNMGGKTATLKTLGLLTAMAQYGLLVPAHSMEFRPRKFIRAHLATAEIPKGLSSFAGEVVFLRDVIVRSSEDGLVLVDEIAHGTNPVEGAAMAQAVLEYLHGQQMITAVTTHFPSLAGIRGLRHLRVKGLDREKLRQLGVDSLQRHMDYTLEVVLDGQEDMQTSDAAIVAEALGLNSQIVNRARELANVL